MKLTKTEFARERGYKQSSSRYMQYSNFVNTMQVLADARREEQSDIFSELGKVGRCFKSDLSCADFMNAHPEGQLKFGQEMGLFPQT